MNRDGDVKTLALTPNQTTQDARKIGGSFIFSKKQPTKAPRGGTDNPSEGAGEQLLSLCKYRRVPPRFDQVNLQRFDEIEYMIEAFVGVILLVLWRCC